MLRVPDYLCNITLEKLYYIIYLDRIITRHIERELLQLLAEYPIVTILGARQSGKTTLARELLHDWDYCNLEAPETRHLAERRPAGLLADLGQYAVAHYF